MDTQQTPETVTVIIPKVRGKRSRGKSPDISTAEFQKQALKLRIEHGLSYQQIADIQGVSKQSIWAKIKDLEPDGDTETFKKHRADVFAKMQMRLLASIDDEAIKRTPVGSRILGAAQLYDKERLETGKSTGNLAVLIGQIEDLQDAE